MNRNYFLGLVITLALGPTACAETPPVGNEIKPQDFYRQASASLQTEVNAKQLADWLANKAVILIDLRSKKSFKHAHIRGAINLPVEALTLEHLKKIVPNSDYRIVIYCTNNFVPTRRVALTTLGYPAIEQLGYSNVHRLEDLWHSQPCRATEKLAAQTRQVEGNAGCESLLPMDRAKK